MIDRQTMNVAKYWHTTAFRLVLVYGALFLTTVMLLMGLVYWRTVGYLAGQIEYAIQLRMHQLERLDDASMRQAVYGLTRRDLLHQGIYGYFTTSGQWEAGNLASVPQGINWTQHLVESTYELRSEFYDKDVLQPVHEAIFLATRTPQGNFLIVGRNVAAFKHFRLIVEEALLEGGLLVIVLGLLVSLVPSLGALRRVRRLTQRCEQIAQGVFAVRLEVSEKNDELDMLASVVNVMLDRVEQLMDEVRNVCNNIAHDLRTPMTRLRSRLHRLQLVVPANNAEEVEEVLRETDVVLGRFRALLRIAEIESHKRRSAFGLVSLGDLLQRLFEFYGPLTEERQVQLEIKASVSAQVMADEELLFEAMANILDNAIRYSPTNGKIRVQLYKKQERLLLDVSDEGPGIPEHERRAVLKRYYRGDSASGLDGQGLGLSIVTAVMNLHGFEFSFEEASKGALARVCFPSLVIGQSSAQTEL